MQPARDGTAEPPSPVSEKFRQTVMLTMGLTFLAQLLGYWLASQADDAGPMLVILLVQAVIVLSRAV